MSSLGTRYAKALMAIGIDDNSFDEIGRELKSFADLLQSNVVNQQLATNISLFGNTPFQSGADTIPYTMGMNGPLTFAGFGDSGIFLEQRLAFERIIGADYESLDLANGLFLAPGETVEVVLEFMDAGPNPITYTPRLTQTEMP